MEPLACAVRAGSRVIVECAPLRRRRSGQPGGLAASHHHDPNVAAVRCDGGHVDLLTNDLRFLPTRRQATTAQLYRVGRAGPWNRSRRHDRLERTRCQISPWSPNLVSISRQTTLCSRPRRTRGRAGRAWRVIRVGGATDSSWNAQGLGGNPGVHAGAMGTQPRSPNVEPGRLPTRDVAFPPRRLSGAVLLRRTIHVPPPIVPRDDPRATDVNVSATFAR